MAVLCALASLLSWVPLSVPPMAINDAVAPAGSGGLYQVCRGLEPGTAGMFVCSAAIGLVALAAGPLVVALALFVFRRQLVKVLKAVIARLPAGVRGYGPPLIATLVFVVGWAGVHFETAMKMGLLPHVLFPAVVGVFTVVSTNVTPSVQQRCASLLAARDALPRLLRFGLVLLVPMALGTIVTYMFSDGSGRVQNEALTEQIVVLLALVVGFFAVVPREGGLLAGAKAALAR